MTTLPKHLGIILDGNRRWARTAGLPVMEGHRRGAEVFRDISFHLFERGVPCISAYVFSTENWKRAEEEVNYLMNLLVVAVEKHLNEYNKRNIKVRVLGVRDGLPASVLGAIERTEEKTAANTDGMLLLCFNYGGRREITDAVRNVVAASVPPQDVTESLLTSYMYGGSEIPDVDVIVRTSGERRASGFMLWRAWYAEYIFETKMWPEMTVADADRMLEEFAERQRRFGS